MKKIINYIIKFIKNTLSPLQPILYFMTKHILIGFMSKKQFYKVYKHLQQKQYLTKSDISMLKTMEKKIKKVRA